ncbi:hypothetical protein NDU88_006290 [Pleurodeles waltl]|uniref:Uncharacterized protein n=1 Tax=Pleurodeles waltl TaxID=8319 RepID=A0AAV7MJF1_PLEWA|nr:hypothetical protein NDU88_006290 [Pleurodeles waltl]
MCAAGCRLPREASCGPGDLQKALLRKSTPANDSSCQTRECNLTEHPARQTVTAVPVYATGMSFILKPRDAKIMYCT